MPYARIAIAGRDGRRPTVVIAGIKRLAPAIVNDVARVDTATPPSSSPLKNADDPAGGRIGVYPLIFAWYCSKIPCRSRRKRSVVR